MKDLRGVEIKEGDTVSFISRLLHKSGDLSTGEVLGFTTKMVTVQYTLQTGVVTTSTYMPHNLCVVQTQGNTKMKEL